MLIVLYLLIPLITGLGLLFAGNSTMAKQVAFIASILVLSMVLYGLWIPQNSSLLAYSQIWMGGINSKFSLMLDGPGKITTLLTAVSFPLIFLATWRNEYHDAPRYFALMLLSQAGLMGVFLASDALLFYFFWELALIPVYFLCSMWGGDRRIAVSFKFFIYTFTGSILMLIGIIYLYTKTPDLSFSWESFKLVKLSIVEQTWFFTFFFIAFAIKMPIFPLHTWQPDTYEQAPTSTTMVMSGVMVKMGLFGIIRWLLPVFPEMSQKMAVPIIILSIIGMLYASLIAIRQDDIKRLIAYSSIAHIGLMCAALFVPSSLGHEGAVLQLFNHGINIIGLWMVVDIIEKQTGIRKMSELGGLAHQAPWTAAFLVTIALANIALPFTNAFVGELLMFSGLFALNGWFSFTAGISIILAAVYTLGMVQKVFLGEQNEHLQIKDLRLPQVIALSVIVLIILFFGLYPTPLIHLGEQTTTSALTILP